MKCPECLEDTVIKDNCCDGYKSLFSKKLLLWFERGSVSKKLKKGIPAL